ncbi:MAG: hypothetical protein LBS31_12680 [Candidatus Adiutrix sp.]|jgi:hypothetical protein|nr:hypothetical protein [Candidatus Adiutrix sp.]
MKPSTFVFDEIKFNRPIENLLTPAPSPSKKLTPITDDLLGEARDIARPKAAVKCCQVEIMTLEAVKLDEVVFHSELLVSNLTGLKQAFAYIATEGTELAAWADSLSDAKKILAQAIRYAAMKQAESLVEEYLLDIRQLPKIAAMCPGPLEQWPIQEQAHLFKLMAPLPEQLGLVLSPKFWMEPDYSASGIFFQTATDYHNCRLCLMEPCPFRRYPGPQT